MRTKNLAKFYVGVCKAGKIGRNGWQPSTCCLCTLELVCIMPVLVPTGFTNLLILFNILLESIRFLNSVYTFFLLYSVLFLSISLEKHHFQSIFFIFSLIT